MKNIIQELNDNNVPIIKIDESLAKVKHENRFSQKLADANAFLEKAGIPKPSKSYDAMRVQDEKGKLKIYKKKKNN